MKSKAVSSKSLVGKLNGASTVAKRKAFKHNLPVAIYEDGKVFLLYRNNRKVEATPEEVKKILHK